MFKHPLYRDGNRAIMRLVNVIEEPIKFNSELNVMCNLFQMSTGNKLNINPVLCASLIFNEIKTNGHNYIKIIDEEWETTITKKTLSDIRIKDLKLAFKNGAIEYKDDTIFFAFISKEKLNGIYNSYLEKAEENFFYVASLTSGHVVMVGESDRILNDAPNEEIKEFITIVLSTLIYSSMYINKKDRVRVENIKIEKDKKNNVPKHRVNQINLFQKISNDTIVGREGSNWKSDKRWIVRGHIRNQFYKSTGEYKLIFIDPYWKGEGIEEIQKVYNI